MQDRDLETAKTQVMPPAGGAPRARGPLETEVLDEDTSAPVSFRSLFSLGSTEPFPKTPNDEPPRATAFSARYQPRGLLGEGGMGEVRLARDKVVGRDVAIKTMRPEVEEFARDRFLREARVQGQLEHPAIVPIYDLGLTEEQRLFFTMKRLRGESLETVLGKLAFDEPEAVAKYPLRRLLAAFVQVALALEYAHRRGVLHRDLKPANVMLGDFGEVYVIDWGLARLRFSGEDDISGGPDPAERGKGETLAGSGLGTPGYMAPEQAAGALELLDGRTDVYGLGRSSTRSSRASRFTGKARFRRCSPPPSPVRPRRSRSGPRPSGSRRSCSPSCVAPPRLSRRSGSRPPASSPRRSSASSMASATRCGAGSSPTSMWPARDRSPPCRPRASRRSVRSAVRSRSIPRASRPSTSCVSSFPCRTRTPSKPSPSSRPSRTSADAGSCASSGCGPSRGPSRCPFSPRWG
ncbi:MAG: serine/threonine protein kinase [Deltaproteobacteria bacterium]|nr:serine/threonine protein kinase [Deltaproteobacteria bacterium]